MVEMSDPFCPDCNGVGITTIGGVNQELGDDSDDGSMEVPCETCMNDEEFSNLADEVLEN
jgi:hypothetical protein